MKRFSLKKCFVPLFAVMLTVPAGLFAQNEQTESAQPQERRGRMWNGERGARFGRNGDSRGRGFGGQRMGMMGMESERLKAEDAIKAKLPDDFAALEKERVALEQKFQELAKKAEVKLPQTHEANLQKLKDFQKKYEKELSEIRELAKTDFRTAMEKLQALYKAEGIELPPMFGMRSGGFNQPPRPGAGGGFGTPARGPKVDVNALKKTYPEDFERISKLRSTDKAEYRKQLIELWKKYETEMKNKEQEKKSE